MSTPRKCPCPFCGIDTFSVAYIEGVAKSGPSPTKMSSATKKEVYVPTSSREDRIELEQQMKNLRAGIGSSNNTTFSHRSNSSSSRNSTARSGSSGRGAGVGCPAVPLRGNDSGSNLATLEQMMIIEAIRLSEMEASSAAAAAISVASSSKQQQITSVQEERSQEPSATAATVQHDISDTSEVAILDVSCQPLAADDGGTKTSTSLSPPAAGTTAAGASAACQATADDMTEEELLQMAMLMSMESHVTDGDSASNPPPPPPTTGPS